MIFLTVGSQIPFDRLVAAVDTWAGRSGREIFAQVCETQLSPAHLQWKPRVPPEEFRERVRQASLVVAHAGMGSILTALEFGKPILVMPRRAALRETRNDHQVPTAKWLQERGSVAVAMDETELFEHLDRFDELEAPGQISRWASPALLDSIRTFIADR